MRKAPRPGPRGRLNSWDGLIFIAATFGAIVIPAGLAAGGRLVKYISWYDACLTILFIADLGVRFRRQDDPPGAGRWITLGADILAALPLQFIPGMAALSVVRLLKLARVAYAMDRWRHQHLPHWNTLRLVYFVYSLGLSVHWLTLGWLSIRTAPPAPDGWTEYIRALYWCVSTLTTIGYSGTVAVTNAEILYSIAVMIFGVATYGYVIANAANILANIDPARAGYFEHMEKLSSFMNYRGIPSELQRRVRDYHAYVWEHRLGYDEGQILAGLPPSLLNEVSMYLKRDVIQHVPFFASVSDELLSEIALAMHPVVYMPGDVIIRKGDVGLAVYFISRGQVEVIGADSERITVLGKGDAVGEMALVLNKPRGATVRAIGFCDLYRLDKSSFDDILSRYPQFADHFRTLTKQRRKQNAGVNRLP